MSCVSFPVRPGKAISQRHLPSFSKGWGFVSVIKNCQVYAPMGNSTATLVTRCGISDTEFSYDSLFGKEEGLVTKSCQDSKPFRKYSDFLSGGDNIK